MASQPAVFILLTFLILHSLFSLTHAVPTGGDVSNAAGLTPHTYHMECAKTPTECYMRYHTYCEGKGLPWYGMPFLICARDHCACVPNENREVAIEERGVEVVEVADEPDNNDSFNPIVAEETISQVDIRTPFGGRKKGILSCPTPDDESECYMRYHRTCEGAGFLPGPSMATEICYNREGCTCTHI